MVTCIAAELIAKQFFQLLARGGFTRIGFSFWRPPAKRKFKILAKISDIFFQNRIGAPLAALMRRAQIVMRAIQADSQIRAAFHANFAATGIARKRPRLATVVTDTVHNFRLQVSG
jgi:hypothetical protein